MTKKSTPPRKPAAKSAAQTAGGIPGQLDLATLEKLGRLMSENDLTLLDLRDGEQRVYLRRGHAPAAPPAQAVPVMQPAPAAPAPAAQPAAPAAAAPPADDDAGLVKVVSPMVGTFYASPNPDAKPFVKVGDKVSADSDVCIIEAMKVFNNIKAEASGTVTKILAKNGDSVEYGQSLFLLKP